jgi:uncharacterized protein with PQ loop repeat
MPSETGEIVSYVFSVLSIVFYSLVYIPQVVLIYKRKSSDGLSPWTVLAWTQADCLSLLGVILLQLPTSLVVMGWYHFLVGVFMVVYVLRFKERLLLYEILGSAFVIMLNVVSCGVLMGVLSGPQVVAGTVFGWLSSSLYILGRFPQLYLNFKRKSTEGLSVLMYLLTILGNTCYMTSVLVYSTEHEYILLNLPWIILTVVTVSCDIIVILQSRVYKRSGATDPLDDIY